MISQRYGDIPLVDDNRQSRFVWPLLLDPGDVLVYAGPDVGELVLAAAQEPGRKKRLDPTDWGRLV